jgi:hypothetical protein
MHDGVVPGHRREHEGLSRNLNVHETH